MKDADMPRSKASSDSDDFVRSRLSTSSAPFTTFAFASSLP